VAIDEGAGSEVCKIAYWLFCYPVGISGLAFWA